MMTTRSILLLCLALVGACADGPTVPTTAPTRQPPAFTFGELLRHGFVQK